MRISNLRIQKHHRFTQHGSKYSKRQIITTNDPGKSEEFYTVIDANALLGSHQYAVGVIRHPITKLSQVWVSTSGFDITCLGAHHAKKLAEADKQEVKALIKGSGLSDEEQFTALFQKLRRGSEEEPSALPNDSIRHINREIMRAVVDRPAHPSW